MNIEYNEIVNEKKENDNNNNLILKTRIMSVVALFEYIGIYNYKILNILMYIYKDSDNFMLENTDKFQFSQNIELTRKAIARFAEISFILCILILLTYIVFIIINHKMSIQKNKKLKKLLIIEIVLLIIFMSLPLISLLT